MQRVFSSRMSSGASSISEENLDDDLEISMHLRRILMDKFVTDWNAEDFMVRQALLYLKRNKESIRDFLKQFPEQRKTVESCIRCLEEMVDNADEVHKKCTTISAAANTMGLISGFFNLVKRGGRLCLGLEVFGDVANISRVIYKIHNNSKIKDKVGELLQQYENSLNYLKISNEEDCGLEGFQKSEALGNQMMDDFISAAGSAQGLYRNIRELNKSTQQKANPSSGSEGRSSTNTTRQRKAKESDSSETPPAASKGNWQDIVIATPAIINKACVVKEDFTHLAEEGKGETGAEIRKIAEKLKLKLEAISLLYTVYMELIDRAN